MASPFETGASKIKGKFEAARPPKEPKKAKPAQPSTAQKKQSGEKKGNGKKIAIICGAVVAALAIGFVGYALAINKTGSIFPNVFVAGVNVGGMSKDEAAASVQEAVDKTYGNSTLAVKLPDRTLSFEPADTKVQLDVASAIEQAWNYGRDQGVFQTLPLRISARNAEHVIDIESSLTLDEDFIQSEIDTIAQEVISARKDSAYTLSDIPAEPAEPKEGETPVAAQPRTLTLQIGTSERSLDAQGLFDAVMDAFARNDFAAVEFDYTQTPFTPVDLETIYNELSVNTKDAYYDSTKKEIVPEVVGYGFDLEAAKQQQAMAEEGSELVIELKEVEPEITLAKLEAKLFHDVLAAKDTDHVYNPDRTTNLRLSCEAIDGTILNPGDIFSFNNIVGERTAAKGYKPATVYVSGESKPELGGGVCQVASNIYWAVLYADLKIVERTEHMFSVSYVPWGMDATIYWGSLDFKFQNDTDYPLRIDASVSDGKVRIALVGTDEKDYKIDMTYDILSSTQWKDVQKVDETKPETYKQVTVTPYTGYTVQTYKHYLDKTTGKEIKVEKEAYSKYSKRDRVTVVGKTPEVVPPVTDPVVPPTTDPVVPPTTDPVVPPATDPGTTTPPATDPVVPPATDPVVPPATDPGTTTPPATDDSGNGSGVLEP